jgi:hypothetical protein
MKIAYPYGFTLSDWTVAIVRAWLARCSGQWVLEPVRAGRRTISSAPRFCVAKAMGDVQ